MEQYLTKVGTTPPHNLVTLHKTMARKTTTTTHNIPTVIFSGGQNDIELVTHKYKIDWFQTILYTKVTFATSLFFISYPNFRLRELIFPWYFLHTFNFAHIW